MGVAMVSFGLVTLVAIFAAVFVVGQQDTVDSPYSLRGLGLESHSASYGFNTHHGTFDNDALDEWGSVTEKVRNRRDVWIEQQPTLDRNPQPNAAQHQEYLDNTGGTSSTYNNRLKYTEGNMANQFPNSNLDAVPVTASQSSTAAFGSSGPCDRWQHGFLVGRRK